MARERFHHIFLKGIPPAVTIFKSISSFGSELRIPVRDKDIHGKYLFDKLNLAWQQAQDKQAVLHAGKEGVYIEFKSDPGADLVTKSLEDLKSKKVRLLNVRTEGEGEDAVTYATVYVSNEKKNHFLNKIKKYAEEETKLGKPKNLNLINSIADIQEALVESFWQDKKDLLPSDEKKWCEVWLSSDVDTVIQRFEKLLNLQEIEEAKGSIKFPERTVKLILADKSQLERLVSLSDDIAEYRLAKDAATFWTEMENQEQADWARELLGRCKVENGRNISVCILDTGVNNGHPLLSLVLKDEDCQAVDPEWGTDDHDGHGTSMAGLVAYGDLKEGLSTSQPVHLCHCLESVKILPRPPKANKLELWGYITDQAVRKAEIQAPERKRIICMAIAAPDTRDRGRPSSWSGRVDQLTSGVDDDNKKLFIISAGNAFPIYKYPDAQITDSVHDPAQSWNALTVGAYTQLDQIKNKSFAGCSPVAPFGGLSPFSTTSLKWEEKWPIKPEILMEGGNAADDGKGLYDSGIDDLSLLSTNRDPSTKNFCGFNMTSAAAAQAAWFAAQIYNIYPDIWPETIRALIVHSAEWTDALKKQFLSEPPNKTQYTRLLRICGYGVPNLQRALYSGSNSLTLIAQEQLQPFDKNINKENKEVGYRTKEMHLHQLPWPKEVLQALPPDIKVRMRVTLSYFIEPGPGEIGWKDRYRYQSHALRFKVKSPTESNELFVKRINAAARLENEGSPDTESPSEHWLIGSKGRDKGSIHSDIWDGSAADLAESGVIAVYPVIGWWRERAYRGRWNHKCRYSLIVSINTPEENIDIYTPVAIKVGITVPIPIDA
jgi:hypothetical protein